ncbi:hypothetical protein HGRIS_010776 [Hohenbuehelia grisea]|uniref:Uncharacterized protein n=1 Tax=Hohenbuehelia grisea TaxID=104357 RepID=A0ABR3IYK1_9AGAR
MFTYFLRMGRPPKKPPSLNGTLPAEQASRRGKFSPRFQFKLSATVASQVLAYSSNSMRELEISAPVLSLIPSSLPHANDPLFGISRAPAIATQVQDLKTIPSAGLL